VRRALIGLCLFAIATPAFAQAGWGMSTGSSSMPPMGSYGSDGEWIRCTNENHEHPLERSIEDCTSIINYRGVSRSYLAGALWYRSRLYEDQGQRDLADADISRAIEIYSVMIEADRRDPSGYNNRASANARLENYDAAMADYERAIELEDDYSSPHLGRGQILFRRGDFAGAMAAFDAASRIAAREYGTSANIYGGKCAARAAARTELDAARRFCDRAVRNSDRSAWALTTRGYLHFMQGDAEAATADFTNAVERDAYYAPALYARGVMAVRQGRQSEGEADMARALEMNRRQVEYFANAGLRP
jgi:tetratricopeptide (TPR) repeat protein